jgi:CheY-like chemotaxis protein
VVPDIELAGAADMLRTASSDSRRRVLLADDDPVVRHVLALVMSQRGLEVEEAGDGLDALDRLPSFAPDIVVTDLNMPRCSGAELCRRLKANPATSRIPVLIVTGSMFRERDLLAAGCHRVLTKPVSAAELADAVFEITALTMVDGPAPQVQARRSAR